MTERRGESPIPHPPNVRAAALLGDVHRVIRRRWATLIMFDVLFKVSAALVFVPFSAWLFARFVAVTGRPVVSNMDITSFFLSPVGVIAAVVSVCVTFWITLAEGAGYTMLASGVLFGIDLRVLDALHLLAKSARRLIAVGHADDCHRRDADHPGPCSSRCGRTNGGSPSSIFTMSFLAGGQYTSKT